MLGNWWSHGDLLEDQKLCNKLKVWIKSNINMVVIETLQMSRTEFFTSKTSNVGF